MVRCSVARSPARSGRPWRGAGRRNGRPGLRPHPGETDRPEAPYAGDAGRSRAPAHPLSQVWSVSPKGRVVAMVGGDDRPDRPPAAGASASGNNRASPSEGYRGLGRSPTRSPGMAIERVEIHETGKDQIAVAGVVDRGQGSRRTGPISSLGLREVRDTAMVRRSSPILPDRMGPPAGPRSPGRNSVGSGGRIARSPRRFGRSPPGRSLALSADEERANWPGRRAADARSPPRSRQVSAEARSSPKCVSCAAICSTPSGGGAQRIGLPLAMCSAP